MNILGQDSSQIGRKPPTGDVAERMDVHILGPSKLEAVKAVDAGGLEEFLTESAAEVRDLLIE